MRRVARLVRLAVVCLVLSCASTPPLFSGLGCTVVPVSNLNLPESIRLRARVRIGRGDRELGFEVIARNGPEALIVVALAPEGTRLFSVRQGGRDIEVLGASSREMKYVALWLMDALHRGFWIEPRIGPILEDGTRSTWEGEQILDVRREDRHWREFRRSTDGRRDGSDVAPVVIEYRESPGRPGGAGFEIRNAWCDYEAVLIPLEGVSGEVP